jgi:hypothetical protein
VPWVVDDTIDATPLEGVPKKGLILRYKHIAIASRLLLIAIITHTNLLTRKSPNDEAANAFLEKHKSLLTNTSLKELDTPLSIPSISLHLMKSRAAFDSYSFDRKVQCLTMAALYCAT